MAGAVDCRSLRRGARMNLPHSSRAGRVYSPVAHIIPKICRGQDGLNLQFAKNAHCYLTISNINSEGTPADVISK